VHATEGLSRRGASRRFVASRGVKIELPDGSALEVPDGATGADVAAAIGPGLARAALAVKVDGELRDLSRPLAGEDRTRPDGDRPCSHSDRARPDRAGSRW
jgi:hypothetical protein